MAGILAAGPGVTGRQGSTPIDSGLVCGIVGYVGDKSAQDVVIDGLRRLEYRGYDSAGIALVSDGRIAWAKKAGKLANLEKQLAETPLPRAGTGIGHTRWATHGAPNDVNAHPHLGGHGQASSRTSPSSGQRSRRPETSSPPRPTPRSWPTSSRARWLEAAR
jgi:hypothetical protein